MGTPVARTRTAIAAAIGVFVCASASPALAAPGDDLLPDLVTLRPTDLSVTKTSKHLQLRLSNTIANRGAGPLEIYPEPSAGSDCDGDGNPADDRFAYQRVFDDSAATSGFFTRGDDTTFTVRSTSSGGDGGCMVFHPAHDHWHFQDFALYELRRESSGKLAARALDASGTKVSFCVIDTFVAFDPPGGLPPAAVPDAFYPHGGESDTCDATATEGLSIGWADIYSAGLPGQRINVDGLPRGKYCLISTADPADRLHEANEANNYKRRRVLLHPRKAELDRLKGPCRLGT